MRRSIGENGRERERGGGGQTDGQTDRETETESFLVCQPGVFIFLC